MKHILHVTIDFEKGCVVPDAKAETWADETLCLAANKHIPHARVSVGTALMLDELRLNLYTKQKDLVPYVHFFHKGKRVEFDKHGYFRGNDDFNAFYMRECDISLGIIQQTLQEHEAARSDVC